MRRLLGIFVLGWFLAGRIVAQSETTAGPPANVGPYFLIRVWPDVLLKYDLTTDTVVARVQFREGVAHSTQLAFDRRHYLAVTGKKGFVEIIDTQTMTVLDTHRFVEDGYILRVEQILETPERTHWYVRVSRIKNELDHYVIEKPQWLYYDLALRHVDERSAELPKPIQRGARISPCGTKWHVFADDLVVLARETFEELGRIPLSKPLYTGMGALSVRGDDLFDGRNPDAYRLFYTMRDPIKTSRSIFGLVDLDLKTNSIGNVRELGGDLRVFAMRYTKDGRVGVAQAGRGDGSNALQDPMMTLLSIDLETGRVLRESRQSVRNGLSLAGMSPDGQRLYLTGRGHELVILDAQHQPVKTVELEGETDGRLQLVER